MTPAPPSQIDPSVLTAPYGGKLTKLFVEDGAHVDKGTPFAEVEVMKMLFPLHSSEAGIISLAKAPGALINAGEVLARLQLDDPALVAKARCCLPVAPPRPAPRPLLRCPWPLSPTPEPATHALCAPC